MARAGGVAQHHTTRIAQAIAAVKRPAQNVVGAQQGQSPTHLLGGEPLGHHAKLALQRDVAFEDRYIFLAREQEQIPALLQPDRLPRLALEPLEHADALDGQADVDLGAELVPDTARALAGRSLTEQIRPLE